MAHKQLRNRKNNNKMKEKNGQAGNAYIICIHYYKKGGPYVRAG